MPRKKSQFKKRRVMIRLYRQFDSDLIYLFESMLAGGDDVQTFIKSVIKVYCEYGAEGGKKFDVTKKIEEKIKNTNNNDLVLRKKIQYHIFLYEGKDDELIEWLETIKLGYRNMAIKSIIRNFLSEPCLLPCLASTNVRYTGNEAATGGKTIDV